MQKTKIKIIWHTPNLGDQYMGCLGLTQTRILNFIEHLNTLVYSVFIHIIKFTVQYLHFHTRIHKLFLAVTLMVILRQRQGQRQSQSQIHFTTHGRSVSMSWYRAPFLGLATRYYFLSECCCLKLAVLFLWGALSGERTGLSKLKSLYDWQSVSMSWFRAPFWDLRPDITSCRNVVVWNLRSCFYRCRSYFTTDSQSVNMSWYRAPLWGLRLDITSCRNVTGWNLWSRLQVLEWQENYEAHEAEWTSFETRYSSENLVAPGTEPGAFGSVARSSDH
jgi:hypothetical protein